MKTNKNQSVIPSHIEDERLVSFLDGEIDAGPQKEMQAHLESCWDCRSRLCDVERSIEKFLRLRQEKLMPPELPPVGPAVDVFRARLGAHQMQLPSNSFLKGYLPDLRKLTRVLGEALDGRTYSLRTQVIIARTAAAVILFSVVAGFVLFSGRLTTVTASELLRRSIEAQEMQLANADQPVVRQRIQIVSKGRSGAQNASITWEVWSDVVNLRTRLTSISGSAIAAESDAADRVRSVLRANRMDERKPLTAVSYKSWRDSLSSKSEDVASGVDANGTSLYTIRTLPNGSPNLDDLMEARMSVRASDYHPTRLYLKVKSAGGYQEFELVENEYEIVSLNSVSPELFAENETAGTMEVGRTTVEEPTTTPTVSHDEPAMSSAEIVTATAETEINVLNALHQIGADVSEQLSVTRSANGLLEVQGIVETDSRKNEILQVLDEFKGNSAVRIHIQTIDEATRALANEKRHTQPGQVNTVEVNKGGLAVDTELRKYFSSRGGDVDNQIRQYASRIVNRSQTALFQASALNRMANRFTAEKLNELDPASRSKWLNILKGYASAVRRETALLRGELESVFGDISVRPTEPIKGDANLIASARRLYDLASANDRVIRSAFTISSGDLSVSAIRTGQFQRNLSEAETLAAAIERVR